MTATTTIPPDSATASSTTTTRSDRHQQTTISITSTWFTSITTTLSVMTSITVPSPTFSESPTSSPSSTISTIIQSVPPTTLSTTSSSSSRHTQTNMGAIAGCSVAGGVLGVVLFVVLLFCQRRYFGTQPGQTDYTGISSPNRHSNPPSSDSLVRGIPNSGPVLQFESSLPTVTQSPHDPSRQELEGQMSEVQAELSALNDRKAQWSLVEVRTGRRSLTKTHACASRCVD